MGIHTLSVDTKRTIATAYKQRCKTFQIDRSKSATIFIANLFAKRLGIDMHFYLCVIDQISLIFVSLSLFRLGSILSWSFRFFVFVLECILLFYDVCDRAFIWIFQRNAFGLRACVNCLRSARHTHILYILVVFFRFCFCCCFWSNLEALSRHSFTM